MSLRSMVNSEPWEEEDDGYTDSDELNDPRGSEHDRHVESERDVYRDMRPVSPPPAVGAQGHAGDPVSLGYLTLDEAKILFNLFVKHFNVAMPILDPITHTHGTYSSHCVLVPTSAELADHQILYATIRLSYTRLSVSES